MHQHPSTKVLPHVDILVEEPSRSGPAVDQLEYRCRPDEADQVTESYESSIVALRDDMP